MQHIVRMMWIFRILLEKKVSVTRIPVALLWRCESSLPPGRLALQNFRGGRFQKEVFSSNDSLMWYLQCASSALGTHKVFRMKGCSNAT